MRKEEKNQLIDSLAEQLSNINYFYLTDISGLNAKDTTLLRSMCFKKDIKLQIVKNTFLKKAFDRCERNFDSLVDSCTGPTSIMFAQTGNAPGKVIKEFRKTNDRPILKAAFIEDVTYVGDDQLDLLTNIKSREEIIGDIIGILQSPAKNVISALQSGGQKISGILETLSEKSE
ncbi:MAG: 50S ribosomal protein L10 [Bacteroidales bacterium]|nr:50S ribosomal protein L10 [Bacteroidales bacterium]